MTGGSGQGCVFCAIVAGDAPASAIPVGPELTDGEAAGQEVFHVHLHVIPRSPGDGFTVDADAWRRTPPTRAELDAQASRIDVAAPD